MQKQRFLTILVASGLLVNFPLFPVVTCGLYNGANNPEFFFLEVANTGLNMWLSVARQLVMLSCFTEDDDKYKKKKKQQ